MAGFICETRLQDSALDINQTNHPTPKWSLPAVRSQRHPKIVKTLTPNLPAWSL